ncbi:MAG: hypothetical protein ABL901_08275 [Hyphomicrobiaceae bacterium]
MAALKVAQLRITLDAFAALYSHAGATEQAEAVRAVSHALARADKLSVDEIIQALEKSATKSPSQSSGEH